MIEGKRLKLTPMQRVVKAEPDPDSPGQMLAIETTKEMHLFMEPGGYARHTDGTWQMQPPGRNSPAFRLVTDRRKVTEHEDGTITVEGPPFRVSPTTAYRLEKGNWFEVPTEPTKTEAERAKAAETPIAPVPPPPTENV
jgi:hypothetical protein